MKITKNIKAICDRIVKVKKMEQPFLEPLAKDVVNVNPNENLSFPSSLNPKVSIIIPFYNEFNYTYNCLVYLKKYLTDKYPFEIILIDDNSTEKVDFSIITGIKIIRNETNVGFLKNINNGIKNSTAEFIYILNNDTEVQKGFLEELFYVFENFENVGAVGSKLINPNGTLQEAGSVFMKNCDINQIVRKKLPFYPEVNYIYQVDYCSGCSLLFKRCNDQGELNLFDEQFTPAYFEETDFCFQLKYIQHKNIYYTAFSEVLHYNGITYNASKSTDDNKIKKKAELFKSNLSKFKAKWAPQLNAIQATNIPERIQEIYKHQSIVFFAGTIPEFDKDSGANRLKEIITAFLELKFHVTLVVKFTYLDNPYIEFFQRMGVNVFYEHKKYTSFATYLKEQKINPMVAWFYSPDVFMKYYKISKKLFPKAKLVYDMVDIHHLRYKRASELDPKRISLRKKYFKYKTIETKAAKKSDFTIPISEFDKNYMKSICDENKLVAISNIHYPKIKITEVLDFEERKDILFIGSTHEPNIDALYYLYNKIMPFVWKELPNVKVNILGNVSEKIKDLSDENFVFHGYISDIVPYFKANKMMVAPLRYGAGVKGKIGQAFEYFLPVVTTSVGAEGMQLENGKNALIDDTPEGFAQKIIELYTNKEKWTLLQKKSEDSLKPFSKENLKATLLNLK